MFILVDVACVSIAGIARVDEWDISKGYFH